jgi:hypothetical protein
MSVYLRSVTVAGFFLCLVGVSARSKEKPGESVENPFYKFWRGFKPGSTANCLETTKLSNPDSKQWTPDGVDEKRIVYKLVEADDKRVVVEMVVTEKEFLGFVQSAPTRYIYPAKVRKQDLERFFLETGTKTGEETLKVDGKEMKVKTVAGTIKAAGGEETEYKLWLSDDVPGSVVKKTRTTRHKGEVIAETTVVLESCKKIE